MKLSLMILFVSLLVSGSTGDPVAEVWERIEVARKAKVKKPNKLNPPASKEDIGKLEKHLGCEIPEQLCASLLLHDGMEDWGLEIMAGDAGRYYRWLSVAGIRKQWDEDRQDQKEATAEGDEFLVHPKWIPIFIDPIEFEEVIYLDTSNGTVLQRLLPASQEIQTHRYADLKSFLEVLEHHIRNELWFDWGNDAESKAAKADLTLNKEGVEFLINSKKERVFFKLGDGKSVEVNEKGNEFANSILKSFQPVKFVRTPGVQNPDYQLSFSVDGKDFLIAIKPSLKGMLSYSIGNTQFAGGDAEKLRGLVDAFKKASEDE